MSTNKGDSNEQLKPDVGASGVVQEVRLPDQQSDQGNDRPPPKGNTYTIIATYFDGRYWEGGGFDGTAAPKVFRSHVKNPNVYMVQLLQWDKEGMKWRLLDMQVKPIPAAWYQERGLNVPGIE